MASTPIPIPIPSSVKVPAPSHSASSSSEVTPEKSSPQGDDTLHVKTESEDSIGGTEVSTPKLDEPVFQEQVRSASAAGEVEQLPPLPEETLLSPEVCISPTLKVAKEQQTSKGPSAGGGSDVDRTQPESLDNALFEMLNSKEGASERPLDNQQQQGELQGEMETRKKRERAKESSDRENILAELDELDVILDAVEEEDEDEEEDDDKEMEEKETEEKEVEEGEEHKLGGRQEVIDDTADAVDGEESTETAIHAELDSCSESSQGPPTHEPDTKSVEADSQDISDTVAETKPAEGEIESPAIAEPVEVDVEDKDNKRDDVIVKEKLPKVESEGFKMESEIGGVTQQGGGGVLAVRAGSEPQEVEHEPQNVDRESEQSEIERKPLDSKSTTPPLEPEPPRSQSEPPVAVSESPTPESSPPDIPPEEQEAEPEPQDVKFTIPDSELIVPSEDEEIELLDDKADVPNIASQEDGHEQPEVVAATEECRSPHESDIEDAGLEPEPEGTLQPPPKPSPDLREDADDTSEDVVEKVESVVKSREETPPREPRVEVVSQEDGATVDHEAMKKDAPETQELVDRWVNRCGKMGRVSVNLCTK